MQLKMKALVFDMVHQIDMVEQLRSHRTTSLVDWQWKKQLRYYMNGGRATVKMHDAVFDYTYEYQGNAPKLVHTPLTDKCYLTLTQGMHMGFGGNPYGPAGTGKTESVKALASCMGRQGAHPITPFPSLPSPPLFIAISSVLALTPQNLFTFYWLIYYP